MTTAITLYNNTQVSRTININKSSIADIFRFRVFCKLHDIECDITTTHYRLTGTADNLHGTRAFITTPGNK